MAYDKGGRKSEKVLYNRRIRRFRKFILITVAAACLIPTLICIILSIRFDRLKTDYNQTKADLDWYRERFGDEMEILAEESEDKNSPGAFGENPDIDYTDVDVIGAQNPEDIEGTRYVYLTFDDGPSVYTEEILDILKEKDVKATFFVCGKPKYEDSYKRIVDEGHTLGMHSYSHKYSDIYASPEAFHDDLKKLRVFLYENTDTMSKYYRFPGGSSNNVSKADMNELVGILDNEDITFFDWNVSAGDDKAGATKDVICANIVNNIPKFKHCIVLMHDAADKKATVEALPEIIDAINGMEDTVMVPITDDTLPVQHIKNN
ncbi:polysaccharide deacetylase [Butyrivibrio sp. XB500-5]|uniref:polysaccharide deacetylase family protein n=1 Tax=Butyrivibrio sp. XB500-5 TaxID=2364880 RepID=UPI000EA9C11C|nr:polysaccharide deacetylase family protein [Butyrivibrio sp. XB500-5]RKM62876.1 polysaccharide deacetylase [Butyrivibrio sp. XB500-5]